MDNEVQETPQFHSLFVHKRICDTDDSTWNMPLGNEERTIESYLENSENSPGNFEIDTSDYGIVTLTTYENVTDPETNENELAEEVVTWTPLAFGGSVGSEDNTPQDIAMWCLDDAVFNLFEQLYHVPTCSLNIMWWVARISEFAGRVKSVLNLIQLMKQAGEWDNDYAAEQNNVPLVVWVSQMRTAWEAQIDSLQGRLSDIEEALIDKWYQEQVFLELLIQMQEMSECGLS